MNTILLLTDFFTSPALVIGVSKVRCQLTGTVMKNRKDVLVLSKKPNLRKGENYHTGMMKHSTVGLV